MNGTCFDVTRPDTLACENIGSFVLDPIISEHQSPRSWLVNETIDFVVTNSRRLTFTGSRIHSPDRLALVLLVYMSGLFTPTASMSFPNRLPSHH